MNLDEAKKLETRASHLPVLELIVAEFAIKRAIEFGMGTHSTPFLRKNCEHVVSIEMQNPEWFQAMTGEVDPHYPDGRIMSIRDTDDGRRWVAIQEIGPMAWERNLTEWMEQHDLALVDGHVKSRPEVVNVLAELGLVSFIVVHDLDAPYYGWERISVPEAYRRIDFKFHPERVTAVFARGPEAAAFLAGSELVTG